MFADARNRVLGSNTEYNPSETLPIFLGVALDRGNVVHGSKFCSIWESVVSELTVIVVMYLESCWKGFCITSRKVMALTASSLAGIASYCNWKLLSLMYYCSTGVERVGVRCHCQ
jgi:hypothetical protein